MPFAGRIFKKKRSITVGRDLEFSVEERHADAIAQSTPAYSSLPPLIRPADNANVILLFFEFIYKVNVHGVLIGAVFGGYRIVQLWVLKLEYIPF